MTIAELGSIGEFVSAIAILITLIYLAIQVRYARRATAASLLEQRTIAVREMYLAIATSETLSDAMSKAEDAVAEGPTGFEATLMDQGSLTRREAHQVSRWYRAMNRVWAGQYQVVTDRWERERYDGGVRTFYSRRLARLFWQEIKGEIEVSGFMSHVDRLVAERDAQSPRTT